MLRNLYSLLFLLVISVSGHAQCPTAAFNLNPSTGCAIPHTVFFTDQSITPDIWLWDFGDGNTSTLQNPVHNYTTTGSFTVTLTVTDTIVGCSDVSTQAVSVSIPNASFSGAPLFGCAPITSNFTDNSTSSGSTVTSWLWDFGDGQTSTAQNAVHSYLNPGVYTVSLTVTDANGCTDTQTQPNYVQAIGPDVNFGADTTEACTSLTVNFTDSTIFGAPITSWTWDFGDGNTSNLQNPTHTYSTTGSFDVSLTVTDIDGCSRTFTRPGYITIHGTAQGTDVQTTCGPFTWIDGNTYTSSNNTATFLFPSGAASGCDSLVTLDLTVNAPSVATDVITACDTYTWIDGNTYTSSNNTATHVLTNSAGCDSTVTLNLTINNSTTGSETVVACDSYTWTANGTTYTGSGTYTAVLTASNGCDSTATLNLTINNATSGSENVTACDSFTWSANGTTFTISGIYTTILTGSNGCDSTAILNLTINNSAVGTDFVTACDSFTWIDGITYTSSNSTATYVLNTVAGCDSTVTLDLAIINSSFGTDVITACDSLIWIDGNTYTASNNTATFVLTNAVGCDSIVSLDATILNSSAGTDVISACDSYIWIDGNTYTASNTTATHVLTNAVGCDSVVTLDLTILPNPNVSQQSFVDVCDQGGTINLIGGSPSGGTYSGVGVSGTTFNPLQTGVGTFDITYSYLDANGCQDSVTEPITVLASPEVSLSTIEDVCDDTPSFTLNGGAPAGGTYSGIGVIGNTFDPSTVSPGMYSISYTYLDPNGCTGTAVQTFEVHSCADVLDLMENNISIYPNPVIGAFHLDTDLPIETLHLFTIDGNLVKSFEPENKVHKVEGLSSGMYILSMRLMGAEYRSRIVIQ